MTSWDTPGPDRLGPLPPWLLPLKLSNAPEACWPEAGELLSSHQSQGSLSHGLVCIQSSSSHSDPGSLSQAHCSQLGTKE